MTPVLVYCHESPQCSNDPIRVYKFPIKGENLANGEPGSARAMAARKGRSGGRAAFNLRPRWTAVDRCITRRAEFSTFQESWRSSYLPPRSSSAFHPPFLGSFYGHFFVQLCRIWPQVQVRQRLQNHPQNPSKTRVFFGARGRTSVYFS